MDIQVLGAVISGIVALLGLFFGVPYWRMLRGLVAAQTTAIARLEKRRLQLSAQVDRVEALWYESQAANAELQSRLDTYVEMAQSLTNELREIRAENETLRLRLDRLNPLP